MSDVKVTADTDDANEPEQRSRRRGSLAACSSSPASHTTAPKPAASVTAPPLTAAQDAFLYDVNLGFWYPNHLTTQELLAWGRLTCDNLAIGISEDSTTQAITGDGVPRLNAVTVVTEAINDLCPSAG